MNKMVVSNKFEHNDKIFKYYTGYMGGCIIYFDNGGKNMSFKIEDYNVLIIYNEFWNKIKKWKA